jgi:hypothetical protein
MGYLSVLLTRPENGVTVTALISDERLEAFGSWAVAGLLADIAEKC